MSADFVFATLACCHDAAMFYTTTGLRLKPNKASDRPPLTLLPVATITGLSRLTFRAEEVWPQHKAWPASFSPW